MINLTNRDLMWTCIFLLIKRLIRFIDSAFHVFFNLIGYKLPDRVFELIICLSISIRREELIKNKLFLIYIFKWYLLEDNT